MRQRGGRETELQLAATSPLVPQVPHTVESQPQDHREDGARPHVE